MAIEASNVKATAEELLSIIRQQQRGKLKIYRASRALIARAGAAWTRPRVRAGLGDREDPERRDPGK